MPHEKIFTRVQRNPLILSRIDHWLISAHLGNYISRAKVIPGVKSDHSVIILNLNNGSGKRGPGFWKFNASLLSDPEYVSSTNTLIESLCNDTLYITDLGFRWDYIKS